MRVPANWPSLDILHLSDLHLRRGNAALLRGQLDALSKLERQPDLICVTGDLCERLDDAPMVFDLLRCARPRFGSYLIPGNHEYAAGAPRKKSRRASLLARAIGGLYAPFLSSGADEGDAIVDSLRGTGLCILRNEGVRLSIDGRDLWLGGVDSGWAGRARPAAALHGRRAHEAALVMVHEPELAFDAVAEGADLVLAGHTHGGQIRLPLVGPPYWHRLDPRLRVASGFQSIGRATLHVSAGTGQVVPIRLGCPPELVWLRCVPDR